MNALDTTGLPAAATITGDRLDELFRGHYSRLARVVGRIVQDQARAEEIAADVFLRWQRYPSAHGQGAEGWLYRTAVRQALDTWRRAQRWTRVERVLAHLGVAPRTPADLHAGAEERRQVRAVLAALKRRDATLLLLWTEEVSYADMASAVGVQATSVGSLLRRAQDAFRKEYEARYGQPS
ncbi:MAG: sigma-70 family RNA polymerase sigma factor [Vicinamibacteraceae bacterium]